MSFVLITICTATLGIFILLHVKTESWFFFGTTTALMTRGGAATWHGDWHDIGASSRVYTVAVSD